MTALAILKHGLRKDFFISPICSSLVVIKIGEPNPVQSTNQSINFDQSILCMAEAFKGSRHPNADHQFMQGFTKKKKKEPDYGKDVWSMLLAKHLRYNTWRPACLPGIFSSPHFCSGQTFALGPCNSPPQNGSVLDNTGPRHGPQARLTNHPPRNPNQPIHPPKRCPSEMWVSGTLAGAGFATGAPLETWLVPLNLSSAKLATFTIKRCGRCLTD